MIHKPSGDLESEIKLNLSKKTRLFSILLHMENTIKRNHHKERPSVTLRPFTQEILYIDVFFYAMIRKMGWKNDGPFKSLPPVSHRRHSRKWDGLLLLLKSALLFITRVIHQNLRLTHLTRPLYKHYASINKPSTASNFGIQTSWHIFKSLKSPAERWWRLWDNEPFVVLMKASPKSRWMRNKSEAPKPQPAMLLPPSEWEYCFHVIRFNIVLWGVDLGFMRIQIQTKVPQSNIKKQR